MTVSNPGRNSVGRYERRSPSSVLPSPTRVGRRARRVMSRAEVRGGAFEARASRRQSTRPSRVPRPEPRRETRVASVVLRVRTEWCYLSRSTHDRAERRDTTINCTSLVASVDARRLFSSDEVWTCQYKATASVYCTERAMFEAALGVRNATTPPWRRRR